MALSGGVLPASAGWRPEGTPAQARHALLFAGMVAAGLAGLLAARFGAEPLVALAGAGVLAAAFLSGYAALALLVVLLLVPVGAAGLPLETNEIDAVYGAALLGILARAAVSRRPIAVGPLGLALAAFVAAGTIALAVGLLSSGDTARALGQYRGLFGYALVPVLVMSLGDGSGERRRMLTMLLCLVGAATAVRGVLSWAELNGYVQLEGVLHRIAAPDSGAQVGVVPSASGTFGYVRAWAGDFEGNTLGVLMLVLIPPSIFLAARDGNAVVRVLLGAGAALITVVLVVSYSRGAYVGLVATALPALLLLARRRPVAAGALAVGGLVVLLLLIDRLPGAGDRVATLRSLGEDPTVQHRQLVYEQVLDAVRANPLWGVGLGTSVRVIGTGADSLYLFVLLRGGLLAAMAFIALGWFALRALAGALREGRLGGLDVAIGYGLVGFAAHALIDYTLWNPKVALVFWLLVGLLMAAALDRRASREEEPTW